MVCTDIAKIILEYLREIKRHEQIELIYQRYKAHFEYVYCVPVPEGPCTYTENTNYGPLSIFMNRFPRRFRYHNQKWMQAQRIALRWALKTRRMGWDWRYWFSRLISESEFLGWHEEFHMSGIIHWEDPGWGFELSSLCESAGRDHRHRLELF